MIQMGKYMKSAWRYPLFFLGLFLIEIGGVYYKFIAQNLTNTEYFVIAGFVIFLISLITP
ncbi:succinate dehydrogenase/fumarate reductase subunit D [Cuniculiplasma divulgatum]|uniref:Succinate dehydrogenase/fumarate reductase subunit D n=2 Tax=Cuniculiplasma divulgatum TaxID=1673428 RepID=A0A1N5T7V6_9ARCH|nr:succinate dehydrogenase/fumarate reductase subunit D [Cuniculiplasma divulgatum]SJK84344.1 succinate dehydrogenase/fumarate reductase subunit D [Cuniculiplasma divulgatum]